MSTPNMTQAAADLRAAAHVLRRDGWVQDQLHCGGGHCAAGAIEVAIDPDGWHTGDGWDEETNSRYNAVVSVLRARLGDFWISTWNDQPGRSADEVIAALEAAADAAEAQP